MVDGLLWVPFKKQERFLSCPGFEVCFGGGAGGGKSEALLIDALTHCSKAGTNALILRRKMVDLERSLIKASHIFYRGRGVYDGQRKRWKLLNGSMIEFGHCQTQRDIDNYYSSQYDYIGIDQVEQFILEMYLFFFSRLRTTNPDVLCKIRTTCNPVGIGRGWIKKRFWIGEREVDKMYEVKERVNLPGGDVEEFSYYRGFISALIFDNPHVMKNDKQYLLRLSQLPTNLRKALMEGDWNACEGTFFTEFDVGVHVIDDFAVPDHWKKWISFDWGYSDPSCVLWFAENPEDGMIYIYRELKIDHTIDVDVARVIADLSREDIYCIFYPWDLDFANPQTGTSMKERMQNVWNEMSRNFYLRVANKDRKNGWAAVRYLLSLRSDGISRMKIFRSCKYLIETIPEQVHDLNDVEDLDTNSDDHAVDALRGFAASYRGFYEKKAEINQDDLKVIDVGAAIKMSNGEYRWKKQEKYQFNWMVE